MAERVVKIINRRGLHARAAAKFVTISERFVSQVEVCFDGRAVAAASIMGLMMLGAGAGSLMTLRAEGEDADDALDALSDLVAAGFNEED